MVEGPISANEEQSPSKKLKRRPVLWSILAVVALLIGAIAWIAVPILLHKSEGSSNQDKPEGWPTTVSAKGDDGRVRTLMVSTESGSSPDLSVLKSGDRLVVSGSGYNGNIGIYVSICKIPAPGEKPTPCLGGIGGEGESSGEADWSASTWVNNDWAWQMFGARSWDDSATGTFTAYLLVSDPEDGALNCSVDECAIFTRADHTASADRIQDLYLPVNFD
ncbi:MAG: hypothetical protein KF916_04485 [Microbacteriaceae bacterium]|nr:hypothetical protein [Microbacteriaceae bacterium]